MIINYKTNKQTKSIQTHLTLTIQTKGVSGYKSLTTATLTNRHR